MGGSAAIAAGAPTRRRLAAQATPIRLLALALAATVATIAGIIAFSVSQPWIGLDLSFDAARGGAVVVSSAGPGAAIPAGTVISAVGAGGDRITLEKTDLTGQVDGSFGPFADFQRFMDRQGRMAAMQRQPQVTFWDTTGRPWTIRPAQSRPITTLSIDFWIGLVVGGVSVLIASAIFVFRPREVAARYVFLSGISTVLFGSLGPIYTSRELALPELPFYLINGANFLGGSLFAAAAFSLLLYYPKKLCPRWVGVAIVGGFLVWYVAQAIGLFPDLTWARRFHVLCALGGSFVLGGIQLWGTRRDPVARAALSWFLLSWVVVVGAFAFTILAPQLFGVDTSAAEPYSFLLFLLVYIGLAVGILRFRLFELGEWWARIMTWTAVLALLAGLDMLFVAGLQLSAGAGLSLALLICGLVWLPARGWITERVLRRGPKVSERAILEHVVQIGLTASATEQLDLWTQVLKARFDPLNLDLAAEDEAPGLAQDGLVLVAPAVQGLPSLRLEYAHGGRTLFSPTDVAEAASLADLLRFVFESRDAYERGVAMERKRIAGDIHDNLGASLLTALHSRDGERKDRLIRESLADLRSIVTEPTGPDSSLTDMLARSRKEMSERLAARGLSLTWNLAEAPGDEVDPKVVTSLRAMLREITNNVVKHAAEATRVAVWVALEDGDLVVTVTDDGAGFDRVAVTAGAGLGGLSDRARQHGGAVEWSRGPDGRGTRVEVRLPAG